MIWSETQYSMCLVWGENCKKLDVWHHIKQSNKVPSSGSSDSVILGSSCGLLFENRALCFSPTWFAVFRYSQGSRKNLLKALCHICFKELLSVSLPLRLFTASPAHPSRMWGHKRMTRTKDGQQSYTLTAPLSPLGPCQIKSSDLHSVHRFYQWFTSVVVTSILIFLSILMIYYL